MKIASIIIGSILLLVSMINMRAGRKLSIKKLISGDTQGFMYNTVFQLNIIPFIAGLYLILYQNILFLGIFVIVYFASLVFINSYPIMTIILDYFMLKRLFIILFDRFNYDWLLIIVVTIIYDMIFLYSIIRYVCANDVHEKVYRNNDDFGD